MVDVRDVRKAAWRQAPVRQIRNDCIAGRGRSV